MSDFARHVFNRMGFGPAPGDIASFNTLGTTNQQRLSVYLEAQMNWQTVNDFTYTSKLNQTTYATLNQSQLSMWQQYKANVPSGTNTRRPVYELERIKLARAVHSKKQLLEIMADFWHDHFSINGRDNYAMRTFTSWDRDVIRPDSNPNRNGHLFGNFRAMLEASAKHAAMLYYLDNYVNGVGSPNENYAREIIELHTLGSENYLSLGDPNTVPRLTIPLPWGNNGTDISVDISQYYVDDDIYAAMRMLTGWKLKDNSGRDYSAFEDSGEWFFYEPWHDEFEKTILGYRWGNLSSAPDDIHQFLDILAYHPGTAKHIAGKLCQKFVGLGASNTLIQSVADSFYQHRYAPDQLKQTYRTLFLSQEFQDLNHAQTKLKRPFEVLASALRSCGTDFFPNYDPNDRYDTSYRLVDDYLTRAGNRPFSWQAPDGFPDESAYWQNPVTLIQTWRMLDYTVDHTSNSVYDLMAVADITISALPRSEHTPNRLAEFWLERLLQYTPSGGWPGTALHSKVMHFMQTRPDSDIDASLWPEDAAINNGNYVIENNSGPYYWHERLRGMVKLILSSTEFMNR